MKVLIVSTYDVVGGAARAASRLRDALCAAGVDCRMRVMYKVGDSPRVYTHHRLRSFLGGRILHRFVGKRIRELQRSANQNLHSLSLFGSGIVDELNRSDADVIHLHWTQLEMLSVQEIARIRKPLVWTLHDMWAFCGAEHVCDDGDQERWRTGYLKDNRPQGDSGLDIDRWTWCRKKKHWKHPIQIVTPSRWLADCVQGSALMQGWSTEVIANTLDLSIYRPWPKEMARSMFGLPKEKPLILFGAWGGAASSNKGGDLLLQALPLVTASVPQAEAIIFGQSRPEGELPDTEGMVMHYTGALSDDYSLALLYSAADVMVVPSRIESLCQTGLEAQACGTPVVCFDKSGLKDAVAHGETGLRVAPYSVSDLAAGIIRLLEDDGLRARFARNGPSHVAALCAPSLVASKYDAVYRRVMSA